MQLVNPNQGFHSFSQPDGAATLLLMAWQKGIFMGNQQTTQPWGSDGYCGSSWVRQGPGSDPKKWFRPALLDTAQAVGGLDPRLGAQNDP